MSKLKDAMKYPIKITLEMSKFGMWIGSICYAIYIVYDLLKDLIAL